MPRIVKGFKPLPTDVLQQRSRDYRVYGYKEWHDPFPGVIGTLPEKMVYAALSFRGIPFWFQDEVHFAIKEIGLNKDFRPDFVIPGLRLIIEVQGAYFHSMDKTIQSDAFKMAVYEQTGWRVLAWWDYEIYENVNALFAKDPQLSAYNVKQSGSSETSNGRKIIRNDSKGVATLNYLRGLRLRYRKPAAGIKNKRMSSYGSYQTYGK